MSSKEIVEKVMSKFEEYFMGDGEESGEQVFNRFAAKHADKFEGEFGDGEEVENKLE